MTEEDKGLSRLAVASRKAAPILDGVYRMIAAVGLGSIGGWWLDKKFETAPWLLILGALLGIGVGMTVFIRAALSVNRH